MVIKYFLIMSRKWEGYLSSLNGEGAERYFGGEMEALETTVQIFPFKIVLLVCLLACFSFRDNSEGGQGSALVILLCSNASFVKGTYWISINSDWVTSKRKTATSFLEIFL